MALDLDSMSVAVINRLRTLPGYSHKKLEHNFCCPVHAEKTASAHYHEEKMGWKCFGCDAGGNLVHLARALHIDIKPFGKDDPPTVYEYQDETGAVVIRKTRKWNDAEKTFYFEHKKAGKWVTGEGPESFLYRLPGVLNAIGLGQPIYIVNGEKAADAMFEAGAVATCSPHGETFADWVSKKYYRWLKGAGEIIIVEQIDAKGREYSDELAKALRPRVRKVSIVRSKTGKPKHDAFDHLRAGYKLSDFVVVNTWQRGFDLIFANGTFKPAQVDYLIEPYLPKGRVVLNDADGGVGKSSWVASLAAALSRAYDPINMCQLAAPVRTMYLIGDTDPWQEYETVYRANGGHEKHCGWLPRLQPDGTLMQFTDATLKQLEETVAMQNIGLMVIDPFQYYLDGLKIDTNVALQVLGICSKIGAIAMRTGCTILAIRHTTKGQVGRKASELGMGSVQFRNSFRGQLVMRYHPEKRGVVVVTDEKGSMLVPSGPPFAFRRMGNEIHYEQLLESPFDGDSGRQYGRPNDRRKSAADCLRTYLESADVLAQTAIDYVMRETGASKNTVRRAAEQLGVVSNNGFWSLDPFAETGKEVTPERE